MGIFNHIPRTRNSPASLSYTTWNVFSSVENRLIAKWPFNTQKSNNNLTKKKDANIGGNKEILNAKGHVNWEQVEP